MTDTSDQTLSVTQTAILLRSTPKTVRRMVREGQLPAYSLPGRRVLRLRVGEVTDWLHEHPATGGDEGDDLAE